MSSIYEVYKIAKNRYWIKSVDGVPLMLPVEHKGNGLPKKAINLMLLDIAFNYPNCHRVIEMPDDALSYQIYTLLNYYPKIPRDDLFIELEIQHDRCYRFSTLSNCTNDIKKSIQGVIYFLKKHGVQYVNLSERKPTNSKKAKKNECDYVPIDINRLISSLYYGLNDLQIFLVNFLYEFFDYVSISLPILYVAGEIDLDHLFLGIRYLGLQCLQNDGLDVRKIESKDKERISNGIEFLKIIGKEMNLNPIENCKPKSILEQMAEDIEVLGTDKVTFKLIYMNSPDYKDIEEIHIRYPFTDEKDEEFWLPFDMQTLLQKISTLNKEITDIKVVLSIIRNHLPEILRKQYIRVMNFNELAEFLVNKADCERVELESKVLTKKDNK